MSRDQVEKVAEMSGAMFNLICAEFDKYTSYENLMVAKWAYKVRNGEISCVTFPLDDMQKYEEKFITPFARTMNDQFIFEKHTKISRSEMIDGKQKSMSTGWFVPSAFWQFYWGEYQKRKEKQKENAKVESKIDTALAGTVHGN